MKNYINVLTLIIATCTALMTCTVTQAERITDPKGLVTFEVPDGWDNLRFKNGRHHTRSNSADDPNILAVVPEERDKYMTIEVMSKDRKYAYAAQEQKLVFEKTSRFNDFDVWESVVEAHIRKEDVVFHTFLMINDTMVVDVHLNASKSDYKKYLPDLHSLFKSIASTGKAKLREY